MNLTDLLTLLAGSVKLSSVRLSVCQSVPSFAGLALLSLQEISVLGTAVSSKCEQCHVHRRCRNLRIHPGTIHPLNCPLSGTTQVSRYQKGKTNLDFTGARDSEWQWHQLGHMQVCTSLRQITMPTPHHSVFYRPDALPATQPTASKH